MDNPEIMATLCTQDKGRTAYWHTQLFKFCDHTCPLFYDSIKQKRRFEYDNDTTVVIKD